MWALPLHLLYHREAAGDAQHLARHEAGIVGDHEEHGLGDLLGLAEALERNPLLHRAHDLALVLVSEVRQELRRLGETRADDVHADAVTRLFARERLAEAHQRRLRAR